MACNTCNSARIHRNEMKFPRMLGVILLVSATVCGARAQDASPPPSSAASPANPPSLARRSDAPPSAKVSAIPNETISLTIDAGTPLQVALENTVRLKQVGEPLHGRIVAPVYAFDKLVIPAGTEVAGKIIRIETISAGKRTLAAMDADFTPARKFDVEFDELILAEWETHRHTNQRHAGVRRGNATGDRRE